MARTSSKMIPLSTQLPKAKLLNVVDGQLLDVQEYAQGKPLLVMFICNHCPFVIHLHKGFQSLYADYKGQELNMIAISSNDVENYPQDSPELMKTLFQDLGFDFPYLYDETQEIAKALDAACTPDFYLFDSTQKLVYRGRFDDSTPGNNVPVTGADIRAAIDNVLSNKPQKEIQNPSIGCNIKWK